jgi:hypothetical protein
VHCKIKSGYSRFAVFAEPGDCFSSNKTRRQYVYKELQKAGCDMKKLSIVGKDFHNEEQVVGYYTAGDRMKYWGKFGAFWGALWGMLFGSALFMVPGIGPIMVFGPLAAWIFSALESAVVVGGLSALGAGLYSIGIPKDSILKYESAIKTGKFLVVAHGCPKEIAKVQNVITATNAAETKVHEAELAVAEQQA